MFFCHKVTCVVSGWKGPKGRAERSENVTDAMWFSVKNADQARLWSNIALGSEASEANGTSAVRFLGVMGAAL